MIQDWLGDRNVALHSMFIAYVWQTVGFSLVLFLAGLQNVSRTLVEASRIRRRRTIPGFSLCDPAGASPIDHHRSDPIDHQFAEGFRHRLRHDGRRPGAVDTDVPYRAFTQAMQLGDFGRGAAISVVLLLITITIVVPYLRWARTDREGAR